MNLTEIMFWILSAMAIGSALAVVLSKNPVHSVLFLIVTFFAISGHYILLNAQFLAIVNVIVYAGAIMVLFLFVVMLMNLNKQSEPKRNLWWTVLGIVSAGALLLTVVFISRDITTQNAPITIGDGSIGLIKQLGMKLFNEYVVPFEISSVLFLSAIVGAVVLGRKESVKIETK